VRDLPLAPLAVAVGRLIRIPVIADLAEPYPDSLRSLWRFQRMSVLDRVVRNPALADRVERFVVRRVDRALGVCMEAGRRLGRQGLPPGRWTEVGNTVALDMFVPKGQAVPELDGLGERCVLLFSGLLAGDRGLDVALEAMARLRARHPGRFVLVIVGEGPMRTQLEAQAAALGLGGDARFTGWIEHGRLPDVIARARIGLLPFQACEHINATLANKLFEYMALGLPVVVSDVPPMVRVLGETGAGVAFCSGDAGDLAARIEQLALDRDARERCAEAGRKASKELYNWGIDGRRLLEAIESPLEV
jgi:glycosyltransferase involved in cell wall biosynthesis